MKLYQTDRAPNPDRVVYFARAKGILDQLDLVDISIMKGEHLTEEYRRISPHGQIPALELNDGRIITESRAICTYLEGLFPEPNLLGETPFEKAQFEMWERRIEFKFLANFAGWFRHSHELMAPLEKPQIPEYSRTCKAKLLSFVSWLDNYLKGRDFLGDRFSNADILLYIGCNFGRVMKYKPEEGYPALAAHYARLKNMGLRG